MVNVIEHRFPLDIETKYTEGECHTLSKALLKDDPSGRIYLLIWTEILNGRRVRVLTHSYYYNRGIYSDIIASYLEEHHREMFIWWYNNYEMNPDNFSIIPIENSDVDMYDYNICSDSVDLGIINRIKEIRSEM